MTEEAAGLAARKAALDILGRILGDGKSLDEAMSEVHSLDRLEPRDRGFAMILVLTTLRRKGEAEAALAKFLAKPLPRKAGAAPLILLIGATELLFLGQPPHAVIDMAVRLAKADQHALHFSGLINAVLRKLAVEGIAGLDGARLNTPDWLWRRWARTYGEAAARAIAEAHASEPPLDLTVKKDAEGWAKRLGGMCLPTGSVRLKGSGPVDSLAGYPEGAWWIQDAAAAIPARLFGDLAGKTALDLCAAPGGKTLQLCAAGARVTAVDSSVSRLEWLRHNLARTGFEAEVVTADVLSFEPGHGFDAVLLDAPCSATGTIRRHPDLPYVKSAAQIERLGETQRRMLDHAARLVVPGGTLIYCTCSLEPAEGEEQIAGFLARNGDFALRPIGDGEAGIPAHMIVGGQLRTLPHLALGEACGLDGFHAARLTRHF
ncbi:MAG: methyltransferase domain-containing protein [Rhizobiales bacterium]|nr:methyltransferase domain-containing protein [Hyphomicrobiales bacterium]MBI3674770.1 methyltransferase domain-containing protein [Hyphomicrobiales bacterium]